MHKVDPKTIEELMAHLEALPEVEQPRRPFAAIKELAPAIDRALARGQDIETIRQMLERAGITLQANSLRAYLRRAHAQFPDGKREEAAPPSDAQPPDHALAANVDTTPPARAPRKAAGEAERPQHDDAMPRAPARGHFKPKADSSEI